MSKRNPGDVISFPKARQQKHRGWTIEPQKLDDSWMYMAHRPDEFPLEGYDFDTAEEAVQDAKALIDAVAWREKSMAEGIVERASGREKTREQKHKGEPLIAGKTLQYRMDELRERFRAAGLSSAVFIPYYEVKGTHGPPYGPPRYPIYMAPDESLYEVPLDDHLTGTGLRMDTDGWSIVLSLLDRADEKRWSKFLEEYKGLRGNPKPSADSIAQCQKLWEHYCARPGKKRLRAVLSHLETMKSSKSAKVKLERRRCLRVANQEAKELGLKVNPPRVQNDKDYSPGGPWFPQDDPRRWRAFVGKTLAEDIYEPGTYIVMFRKGRKLSWEAAKKIGLSGIQVIQTTEGEVVSEL